MPTLPRTHALLTDQMTAGLHTGFQLYCSIKQHPVADLADGTAGPGREMTPETMMLWMSAGKPVTAVALAQLWEGGKIDLDDTVTKFIPEFAHHGKERITLRHCLTHTAGFRGPLNNFTGGTWDEIITRICGMRSEWPAGTKAGYHAATSWFILGEVVQRASGIPFSQYVRERIFLPLDMVDCHIGMPSETYQALGKRLALLPAIEDGGPKFDTPANTEASTTLPRPGANGRGPMSQLGKLYEMLLNKGAGGSGRLLSPQTAEAITSPHRVGMYDISFQHKIDWALGFLVNSNHYGVPTTPYGYGPHASGRTFGHSGNQSSVAFADPEHQLVVAVAFNGLPGEPKHQARVRDVLTTLYEELELVSKPSLV